ncbi:MAG: hypothetical protein NZL98_07780 [Anaerolineales bacterium]|nr:hypothetical protein [Anaerolineales bacterium]
MEVVTIENDSLFHRETRSKKRHQPHNRSNEPEHHSSSSHHHLLETILDYQLIVARGMGQAAYEAISASGREAICTPLHTIEEAL